MNQKELRAKLEHVMRGRELFTAADLIKLGLYGGRSTVWSLVSKGALECLEVTERRRVITRDSVINHILSLNKDKEEAK